MLRRSLVWLASLLVPFAVGAAAVYVAAVMLVGPRASAQQVDDTPIPVFNDIRQAEEAAGFKMASLESTLLPLSFDPGPIYVGEALPNDTKRILRAWGDEGLFGGYILLIQDPTMDGLVGGQHFTIGSRVGQRVLDKADAARPFDLVSFYWRDGTMSYALTAGLVGEMTEGLALRIAASVQAIP